MGSAQSKKPKEEIKEALKGESKDETKKKLKNEPKNEGNNEVMIGHKPIPVKIIYKITKAVCKITIETNQGIAHGTGFFLNYSD